MGSALEAGFANRLGDLERVRVVEAFPAQSLGFEMFRVLAPSLEEFGGFEFDDAARFATGIPVVPAGNKTWHRLGDLKHSPGQGAELIGVLGAKAGAEYYDDHDFPPALFPLTRPKAGAAFDVKESTRTG